MWKKKNNCHVSNQHPPIYQSTKFHARTFKLGSKNVLSGYFWDCDSQKLLLCLKSTPPIFQNANFCAKIEIPKFGTKDALF